MAVCQKLRVQMVRRPGFLIRVYINGVYRGTMGPYGDIFPIVGDLAHEVTTLYAESNDGRNWSRNVYSNVRSYHWTLFP
jgi:hypothetical protein